MKKIISIVVVIAVILLAAAYFGKDKAPTENGPIKIGAVLSLTGVAAQFGDMAKMSMEMAVEEINTNGGMNGRMVELYIEDDHTVPKDAVSAWRKVVDVNKVDAVVGGLFDFTAQPLFPIAQSEKITFISPINFVIPGAFEMNEYSFVMYPEFEKAISEVGAVIAEGDYKKVGMIRFQSDFGAEIERVLNNSLISVDRDPLVTETYAEIGGSDFRTPIIKLKEQNVDTVFLDMLDFDIVTFLQRAHEQSFKPQIIGYTTIRDVLGKSDLIEGAIMLDWEVPSEGFIKKFEARYGTKPLRGNNKPYDAVYVLAEAIANSKDRSEVPAYMEKNSFETVNGKFSFTEKHSVADTPVKVMKVVDGKLVEIRSN